VSGRVSPITIINGRMGSSSNGNLGPNKASPRPGQDLWIDTEPLLPPKGPRARDELICGPGCATFCLQTGFRYTVHCLLQ
jgi:hypothetical protein